MPATAWDLFCSAWFSVFSHWLTANSSFSHRSCSLSGWQCLLVLLCSARFIFSACQMASGEIHGPAYSQHTALIRTVRKRGYGREDPGQDRGLQEERDVDGRPGATRLRSERTKAGSKF